MNRAEGRRNQRSRVTASSAIIGSSRGHIDRSDVPAHADDDRAGVGCGNRRMEADDTTGRFDQFGFMYGEGFPLVDDVTVQQYHNEGGGPPQWHVEFQDNFDSDNGYASDELEHDAAGNLTYDGIYEYQYDAWNRLVRVRRAWRDQGVRQTGATVQTLAYDGQGRQITKTVQNSGVGLGGSYHYYHAGQSVVEVVLTPSLVHSRCKL